MYYYIAIYSRLRRVTIRVVIMHGVGDMKRANSVKKIAFCLKCMTISPHEMWDYLRIIWHF